MGAMRMNNKHLSDTIQVCRYVIENTEKLHTDNLILKIEICNLKI